MKKYLVEFIGTFLLALTILLTGNPLAIGAVLAVMVYTGGDISGGHYNPAVSIAAVIRKKLTIKELPMYVLMQILGAIAGAVIGLVIIQKPIGALSPTNIASASLVELLFTFALVYTVLSVATRKEVEGNQYFGLAIGGMLGVGILAGNQISGAFYNPAMLIGNQLISLFTGKGLQITGIVYLLSQILGALIASALFIIIGKEKEQTQIPSLSTPSAKNIAQIISKSLVRKPSSR